MNFSCKSGEHRLFLRAKTATNEAGKKRTLSKTANRESGAQAPGPSNGLASHFCTTSTDNLQKVQSYKHKNIKYVWKLGIRILWLLVYLHLHSTWIWWWHSLLLSCKQHSIQCQPEGGREKKKSLAVQVNLRGNSCESVRMPASPLLVRQTYYWRSNMCITFTV